MKKPRKTKPPSRVRSIIRTLRISPEDDLQLVDRAKAAGKPISVYLRDKGLGTR